MKKYFVITMLLIVVLVSVILLDTIQAKVFNNSPIIKITKTYSDCQKRDIGIFVITDIVEGEKNTFFKWQEQTLPLKVCGLDSSDKNAIECDDISYDIELEDRMVYIDHCVYVLDKEIREEIQQTIFDYMIRSDNKQFDEVIESISKKMEKISIYRDGGTTVYRDKDKTMIVCKKVNGNKDIYFGNSSMEFEQNMCE